MTRPRTAPEPNNAQLSHACEVAYGQFQSKMTETRQHYTGNEQAQKAFDELEMFFTPLLKTLVEQMKTASSVDAQRTLVLQMMRDSYNEMVMVSGSSDIDSVANGYINDMIDAYSEQVDKGGRADQFSKLKDPGGTFRAILNYSSCLNAVSDQIEPYPALEVRAKNDMPMGPVTEAQRIVLRKGSEAILRKLGEPLIDQHMPFQPDMLSVALSLMIAPDHLVHMLKAMKTDAHAMPESTVKKWQQLQRDYPDMATNPESVANAAMAASIGRGRGAVH